MTIFLTRTSIQRRNKSFRKSMLARGTLGLLLQFSDLFHFFLIHKYSPHCSLSGNSQEQIEVNLRKLDSDELINYNPKLKDYTPATRIAYARFKGRLMEIREPTQAEGGEM